MDKTIEKIESCIKKIEDKDFNVFFVVIDSKGTPSGSLAYIYETAKTLKDLGYKVKMLHAEKKEEFTERVIERREELVDRRDELAGKVTEKRDEVQEALSQLAAKLVKRNPTAFLPSLPSVNTLMDKIRKRTGRYK